MDKIRNICKDKAVPVVEDAAQAMGGKYNGNLLGTIGDVGFFSLGRGKNITSGSGGIVITNNEMIAGAIKKIYGTIESPSFREEMMELLRVIIMTLFIRPSFYWLPSGLPFLKLGETIFYSGFPVKRFSGMKAGLLNGWQKKLEESNKIRKENAKYFCSTLASTLTFHNGKSISFLRLPIICTDKDTSYRLYSLSKKKGIGIVKMYPSPVNEIKDIKDQFKGEIYPGAKKVSDGLLTVPTHKFLTESDKENIFNLLNPFLIFILT
jgi:dTDP-4-amino-4,6-dideoxygalactose transaminase